MSIIGITREDWHGLLAELDRALWNVHGDKWEGMRLADKARQDEQARLSFETVMEFQGDDDRVKGVTRGFPRGTECV